MKIDRIELHHVEMPLVQPFRTSFGVETVRPCILVAIHADGLTGWGECVAAHGPYYSYETIATAWHVLVDFLVPPLVGADLNTPADLLPFLKRVRGHPMAKAGLEIAGWDLIARARGVPLHAMLGGVRDRVPVGVSIGIQESLPDLQAVVDGFVAQGYRRVKVKIEPGWEVVPLTMLRERFPDLMLMGDANSAFTLADTPMLRALDDLDLIMLEQPLAYDDIANHARLQAQIKTAVCLDECIHSIADAQTAIDLHACRLINMKVGRVGGLGNALRIHDLCQESGIGLWCGGMLETGVGRAVNLHLATLPNFVLPGDISATDRYYHEDIADPPFVLNSADSTITVPAGPGSGITVNPVRLARYRVRHLAV